jgi:spore germination protein KA
MIVLLLGKLGRNLIIPHNKDSIKSESLKKDDLMVRFLVSKKHRKWRKKDDKLSQHIEDKMKFLEVIPISKDLQENVDRIRNVLGTSDDLVVREFSVGAKGELDAVLIYIDGLTDGKIINDFILRSLMFETRHGEPDVAVRKSEIHEKFTRFALTIGEVKNAANLKDSLKALLAGDGILLLDGSDKAILPNIKGWERRGIEEPNTESVVRGPRDGFTETLRVNTAQIRRRLQDPDLRIKNLTVGKRTNTNVVLIYIEGIADPKVVAEAERRIQKIDIDGALESGYIEQFIEDSHWSPFPQIQNTERPDKATSNLLEGKIVIIVDGSPFALIAPAIFTQFYQSPEDYYERFLISTLIRFIRMVSMFIALLLPSMYISFSSFHPEMIPSKLVIAMAAGRSTVPFPSIVEALLMEATMEILREASVRLPGPIGPTIGIVGALVVGQAAVQAGIVSPIMVIIVALTTIGSFASPSYSAAIALRMLRFPIMIIAAIFGLYGIMLAIILIVIHLSALKSFGVPYLTPLSPRRFLDMKDSLVRAPLYWMQKRPTFLSVGDVIRSTNGKGTESDALDDLIKPQQGEGGQDGPK